MAKKKKQPQRTWMLPSPTQRIPKAPVSASIKADLDAKAKALVGVLKLKFVQPPPKGAQFNYIIDVWTKWLGGTLYFGATYACPGPNAISPSFESRFARMEHVGGGRFALSYMVCFAHLLFGEQHAAHGEMGEAVPEPKRGRVPGPNRERVLVSSGLREENRR